jgi:hypothetical protein
VSSVGQLMDIELMLGNIDADDVWRGVLLHAGAWHGTFPVLRMRAPAIALAVRALAAVRASSTRPATIMLRDGLGRPRHDRSVAGRRERACFATLRSLSHGDLQHTLL